MILANDGVPEAFKSARDGIADDRAAQMPHMHLLRKIHAHQVNDDSFGRRFLDAKISGVHLLNRMRERAAEQLDVDETGSGDRFFSEWLGNTRKINRGKNLHRNFARWLAHALGESHRRVALVVAKLGVLARDHHGVSVGGVGKCLGNRVRKARANESNRINGHAKM